MIVEEPVRGTFAYLEQPGLFAIPPVEQLRLFVEGRLPVPPVTHLTGLVVEEASEAPTRRQGDRRATGSDDRRLDGPDDDADGTRVAMATGSAMISEGRPWPAPVE